MAGPETFRADYLHMLRQLTFNSKPLIDALTILAEENKFYAQIVVDCVKDKLIRVGYSFVLFFHSSLLFSLPLFSAFSIVHFITIFHSFGAVAAGSA